MCGFCFIVRIIYANSLVENDNSTVATSAACQVVENVTTTATAANQTIRRHNARVGTSTAAPRSGRGTTIATRRDRAHGTLATIKRCRGI